MSFIFADGWLITMNDRREILERGSVAVDGDRITAIGSRRQLEEQYPGAEVIYCSDRIVMPGMVNTHTHMFQTLLKGLGDDMVLKKWFTCMTGPSGVQGRAGCTSPLRMPMPLRFMAASNRYAPG
jgi:5-methylthioadenosine/S-adenosylhomocysteine deaminase